MRPLLAAMLVTGILLVSAAPASATEHEIPEVPFTPAVPTLQLPIPGFPSFSTLQVQQGDGGHRFVDVPFVAEYIVAFYRYALGIIVTLAMVMIVIGGIRWASAAGNASAIGAAKDTIVRAVMGLLIAFGSYTILYLINPELVNFRALRIDLIRREDNPVVAELDSTTAVEGGGSGGGAAPPPAGGGTPASSESCNRLAEIVRAGGVTIRNAGDRNGILAGGVIRRQQCAWCYNGPNDRSAEGPCFDEDAGRGVQISPNICQTLVDLHEAKVRGDVTGNISVSCIICGHTRCASGRWDSADGRNRCNVCMRNVRAGRTGEGSGQSNHWDGRGMDLAPNASIQRYLVTNLFPDGAITDVYGPVMNTSALNCPSGPTGRTGRGCGPYICLNGRCDTCIQAQTACGHRDHIHVSVR